MRHKLLPLAYQSEAIGPSPPMQNGAFWFDFRKPIGNDPAGGNKKERRRNAVEQERTQRTRDDGDRSKAEVRHGACSAGGGSAEWAPSWRKSRFRRYSEAPRQSQTEASARDTPSSFGSRKRSHGTAEGKGKSNSRENVATRKRAKISLGTDFQRSLEDRRTAPTISELPNKGVIFVRNGTARP